MIKMGIIGINQGNGHPYSFSAIINGYNKSSFNRKDWDVIYQYLEKCHPEDFFNQRDVQISYVYTQDLEESKKIAYSCNIPNIANNIEELLDNTDGIILAMDTWETHLETSKIFLESNKYVFIDKPLSLKESDLDFFIPYLKSSHLMSCSGMMFARELDEIRKKIKNNDERVLFIEGSIGYQWDRYLVHIIDAILGVINFKVHSVKTTTITEGVFTSFIDTGDFLIQLNSRNQSFSQPATITIVTNQARYTYELHDNFSAFRRTMGEFLRMIKNEKMIYDYTNTIQGMKILQEINREICQC